MARWEFKLPDIGEGIAEGEIVGWLIKPGDAVKDDQPMVEVMTDKATVTITAPKAGTVVETRGVVGEIVKVHAVLVVFELDGAVYAPSGIGAAQSGRPQGPAPGPPATTFGHLAGAAPGGPNGATNRDEGPAATAVGDLKEVLPGLDGQALLASAGTAPGPRYFNEKPLATPATRKLARDMNIDLRRVPPSGPQGRVTKRDVESLAHPASVAAGLGPMTADTSPAGPGGGPRLGDAQGARRLPHGPLEERVPFAGLRRRIAQKMALSTRTAAHFTFVEECDATQLKAVRARLMGAAEAQGVRLTLLPFIVKATAAALKKHPMLNTALDESTNELVFRKYFHIGVATATDAGLVVPVVKDADRKSILEIGRDIDRLSAEARAGQAKLEDLQGSTFTITSPGAQGGFFATPIINFPEVAILGVHRIKERAVVKEGQIVIGNVMLLSLSFDHRIVDGLVGAAFAYEIIGYLEQPDRLMLEMA
jgi:pyruvate dehydrogenase E2 component (dihydrolipoyllysine-residue acetyltransferase)